MPSYAFVTVDVATELERRGAWVRCIQASTESTVTVSMNMAAADSHATGGMGIPTWTHMESDQRVSR